MNHIQLCACLLLALGLSTPAGAVDAPKSSEFAWHATLALPAGASVARVTLPPEAMLRLQSSNAQDVRVFNAQGDAVAFAFAHPGSALPTLPPPPTRSYTAYPLFAAAQGQRQATGSVQVHLDQSSQQGSVWVRFGGTSEPASTSDAAATQLTSVLFDTRREQQTITALTLDGELPPNKLVHLTLASSPDLRQWTPVAVRGPVYRFEGSGAPSNNTLELAQALRLEGQYLRLSWDGQTGVQVNAFTGSVAPAWVPPTRVQAPLPPAMREGNTGMIWPLDFATPLAALHLNTSRNNTLVPVRILGRNDAAQAWRPLATTVVYRLGSTDPITSNPAVPLGGISVRWLKVEASNGMTLPAADWQATVEFEPIQLVFLASGQAPFELAVGRAHTLPAAVDASLLTSVVAGKLQDLPSATLTAMRANQSTAADAALLRLLPAGTEQRSVLLWLVLLGGVLLLAGVAYSLLRQLSNKPESKTP